MGYPGILPILEVETEEVEVDVLYHIEKILPNGIE